MHSWLKSLPPSLPSDKRHRNSGKHHQPPHATLCVYGLRGRVTSGLLLHLEHGRKYELHGSGRGLRDAEDVEMPHEAGGNLAAPAARGSRPGDEHRVRYLLPEQFVAVVEPLFRGSLRVSFVGVVLTRWAVPENPGWMISHF